MKNKNTYIFFRNDDVRQTLDEPLQEITRIFIKHGIPISHAVEPANVSLEVVEWLKEQKQKYPNLIEIIQHGFDHSNKNKVRKGEFGGQREYEEQFLEIKTGKGLMNKYFDTMWFNAFCFPNGSYNYSAMKAVYDNKFNVINGTYINDYKHQLFYLIAHTLQKEILLNYRVPYNLKYRPANRLFQININISLIKKYLDGNTESILMSIEELKSETLRYTKEKTIGILLHHRYHNTNTKIELIDQYLVWLKTISKIQFTTMANIYNKFK